MNETRKLARFVVQTQYNDLPERVREQAKACVLDYLGSALFCAAAESTRIVSDFVRAAGCKAESTVIANNWKTSAQYAALVNGTMGHGFELDDFHGKSFLHPGTVVIPSALAMAEKAGGDGKQFITAVVLGYETMIRVGLAVGISHNFRGFHPTGTAGPFGSAAAAGKVLGLNQSALLDALGSAGSLSSGIKEFAVTGSMIKRYHAGKSSENGVVTALLASRGFTGPASVLEGKFGFLQAFSDKYDPSKLIENLATRWEILNINVKPYACCGGLHSMIDGLLTLKRAHSINPKMIKKIKVETIEKVALQNSGSGTESVMAAQYSIPFTAALTILKDIEDCSIFSESILKDKSALSLSKKVEVLASIKNAGMEKSRVSIETAQGDKLIADTEKPKGHPDNPLTTDEVIKKFKSLATKVVSNRQAEKILEKVRVLEKISDIKEFTRLLQKKPS
jgi:2-methylcitrate dehydratase PrpD